jgi:hypothetical protein
MIRVRCTRSKSVFAASGDHVALRVPGERGRSVDDVTAIQVEGGELTAAITKESADELGLTGGSPVVARRRGDRPGRRPRRKPGVRCGRRARAALARTAARRTAWGSACTLVR